MIKAVPSRIGITTVAALLLSGCTTIGGTVSAIFYAEPPQPPLFFVIAQDSFSVTERNISALIEAKMSEKGYQKSPSFEAANVGVFYKYSIDSSGSIHSVPDYAAGGHQTYTTFPRTFQISVIDLQKSKIPEKIEFLWQGELYSAGSSRNISQLAPYFIEVLFENYGRSVSNKNFSKDFN